MLRLLAAILIICSFTAQLGAQASKDHSPADQVSKDQASKDQASQGQASQGQASKDQASTAQTAAPSTKAKFPLEAFQEFSAIMVGSLGPGDDRESHIYRSGKLMRNESLEAKNFFITNATTGESYGVAATGCIHDSHAYFRSIPFAIAPPDAKVEVVAAGQETVDGHSCKMEDVTVSSSKFLKPFKMRLWEADDLQGFPIQVKFLRGFGHDPVIRYKNVVLGPQDPTLFIYPNSCEESMGSNQKTPKVTPKAKKPAAAPPSTPKN